MHAASLQVQLLLAIILLLGPLALALLLSLRLWCPCQACQRALQQHRRPLSLAFFMWPACTIQLTAGTKSDT